jgi:hypothetical protein
MSRNFSVAEAVYQEIVERGCMRKSEVLRFAGQKTTCADNFLICMEVSGFLLSEDERGVLYPFRRIDE